MYNENYYESCDTVACISKQTYNIVKNVRQRKPIKKSELKYIPHGIDEVAFKPLNIDNPGLDLAKKDKQGKDYTKTEFEEMLDFKRKVFGGRDYDFAILYNNRNIRRKMPGDVILAFSEFVKTLPKDDQDKVVLIMHTAVVDNNGTDLAAVVDNNGTDLAAVKKAVAPDCHIIFSNNKFEQRNMMYLYNMVDVTINIASNEGFGLSSAESLMCGTPIINNITGGLQDQVGFVDKNGAYLDPDKHYNAKWGSNHDGKYKKHGEWASAVFPSNRALVGSPPTPYIFDDRCKFEDVAVAMRYWYDKSADERIAAGQKGRDYLFEVGMTAKKMGFNFIDYINSSIDNWKPRTRFSVYSV
jgi:glycosyltransferase involved in cell wall biosynthesis